MCQVGLDWGFGDGQAAPCMGLCMDGGGGGCLASSIGMSFIHFTWLVMSDSWMGLSITC